MTKEFFEACMRVPTVSNHEDMMIEFLLDWAKERGISARKDGMGNVYMTKGTAKFYPCLGNHTDSVHHDQEEMVKQKVFKEIRWEGDTVKAFNPLTDRQTGLGMDDQGGCVIALAVMERLPACKGIFVVQEEVGMKGSLGCDKSFFDDVSFVISNDSPDRNRATHYSSGVELYSKEFFEKYLEPICRKHGVTKFNSEPYTDVKTYRQMQNGDGKHLECFNFGNGGYAAHTDGEYAKFADVNAAEELLYALCTGIPSDVQHVSDIHDEPRPSYSWSGYSGSPYSGYRTRQQDFSDYWKGFGLGRKKDAEPALGANFTWAFKDEKTAADYVMFMKKSMKSAFVMQWATDKKKVSVEAKSESDLKRAWMWAYNRDNDEDFISFEALMRDVKGAKEAFAKATKKEPDEPLSPMERPDSDEAALFMPFDDEDDMLAFMTTVGEIPNLPVETEDDNDGVAASGPVWGLKALWVLYFNQLNGTKYLDWKSFSKSEGADSVNDFYDNLTFDDDVSDDDDVIDVDSEIAEPEPVDDDMPDFDSESFWTTLGGG